MLCSDLLYQFGHVSSLTGEDLTGPALAAMRLMQQGPLASYMPFTPQSQGLLASLAQRQPKTLATMQGSSYTGEEWRRLTELAVGMKEVFDPA